MSAGRWLPLAAVTLLAAAFAWLNRGERVAVDLGFATVYRAPFTFVFFLAFLAGMVAMLALGLRHDLRVRRELRARGLLDETPPRRPAPPLPLPASSSDFDRTAWMEAAPRPASDAARAVDEDGRAAASPADASPAPDRTLALGPPSPAHHPPVSPSPDDADRTVGYGADDRTAAHSAGDERFAPPVDGAHDAAHRSRPDDVPGA